ncbi:MAG: phosphatidate cytidylyltransferase [Bacilli bacterium]
MKKRIISGLIALIIVIPLIIVGGIPYYIGVCVLAVLAFRELMGLKEKEKDIPKVIKFLSVLSLVLLIISNSMYEYLDYRVITFIIFLHLLPLVMYSKSKLYNISDALFSIGTLFFLGLAFSYLITIRIYDIDYLIILILVSLLTDTFSFITGSLIGKHKLCKSISPNKTWEGFIGGVLFSTFICTCFYVTAFDYSSNIIVLIAVVSALSIISQLGDLVCSCIKRYYKVKDFSNIMPGHGGIIDRLDSILFVMLAFSFLMSFI